MWLKYCSWDRMHSKYRLFKFACSPTIIQKILPWSPRTKWMIPYQRLTKNRSQMRGGMEIVCASEVGRIRNDLESSVSEGNSKTNPCDHLIINCDSPMLKGEGRWSRLSLIPALSVTSTWTCGFRGSGSRYWMLIYWVLFHKDKHTPRSYHTNQS